MKKTMILLERKLNAECDPVDVEMGLGTHRKVPFGTWYRKHHPGKFKSLFEKWKEKDA